MEIIIVLGGLFILLATIVVYLMGKFAKRRMQKSRYGNTFDFSRIPKMRIQPATVPVQKKKVRDGQDQL